MFLDQEVCCAAHLQLVGGDGQVQIVNSEILDLLTHALGLSQPQEYRQGLVAHAVRGARRGPLHLREAAVLRHFLCAHRVRGGVLRGVALLDGLGRVDEQLVKRLARQAVDEPRKGLAPVVLGEVVPVDGSHLLQEHDVAPGGARGGLRLAVLPADARLPQRVGRAGAQLRLEQQLQVKRHRALHQVRRQRLHHVRAKRLERRLGVHHVADLRHHLLPQVRVQLAASVAAPGLHHDCLACAARPHHTVFALVQDPIQQQTRLSQVS
mmetsp:Transcript_24341/g.46202  ORF Transcript_24341/g.46202 Transcript_24341/m.46202 type:complete len:266 (-) Transcript_24341:1791-2588(-)